MPLVRFKVRGRTAAEWADLNEVLLEREQGLETDTRLSKFGDGITPWNSLPYGAVLARWGAITGNLTDQADLSTALAGKLSKAQNLADLPDKPAARGNLGLGTIATQAANNVMITGGSITGLTALSTTGVVKAVTGGFSGAVFTGLTGVNLLTGVDAGKGFVQAYNFDGGNVPLKLIASALEIQVPLGNYPNDSAAAAGGVPVNGVYRNGSALMVRVS